MWTFESILSAWKDLDALRRLMSLDSRSSSSRSESMDRSGSRAYAAAAALLLLVFVLLLVPLLVHTWSSRPEAAWPSTAAFISVDDDKETVRVSSICMFLLISPMSAFSVVAAIRRTMSRSLLSSLTKMLLFA